MIYNFPFLTKDPPITEKSIGGVQSQILLIEGKYLNFFQIKALNLRANLDLYSWQMEKGLM